MSKEVYRCKYFHIEEQQKDNMKTKIYWIFADEQDYLLLGVVKWYSRWRKYCFYSEDNIVWDTTCLNHLVKFINDLNKQYKERFNNEGKEC